MLRIVDLRVNWETCQDSSAVIHVRGDGGLDLGAGNVESVVWRQNVLMR